MNMETGREEVVYDEDLDEDKNSVFSRLPHDMTHFLENITTAQGCLLLLVLREHLKVSNRLNHAPSKHLNGLLKEHECKKVTFSSLPRSSMVSTSPRYPPTRLRRVKKFTRGQLPGGLELNSTLR